MWNFFKALFANLFGPKIGPVYGALGYDPRYDNDDGQDIWADVPIVTSADDAADETIAYADDYSDEHDVLDHIDLPYYLRPSSRDNEIEMWQELAVAYRRRCDSVRAELDGIDA